MNTPVSLPVDGYFAIRIVSYPPGGHIRLFRTYRAALVNTNRPSRHRQFPRLL